MTFGERDLVWDGGWMHMWRTRIDARRNASLRLPRASRMVRAGRVPALRGERARLVTGVGVPTGAEGRVYDGRSRVLPPPVEDRATVTVWAAHLACDADLRAKAKPYADIAAQLTIRIAS